MNTTIQKITGDWTAGYINKEGINSYVAHAKTKDELINRLTEMVVLVQSGEK